MSETIQPLGSRVLVRISVEEPMTKSGLYVPDTAKEKPQRGEVAAVGDDTDVIKVSVGDAVLFPKYTGTEIKVDGADHLLIEATELLAILRPASATSTTTADAPALVTA
jgi:chaperonin GroES